MTDTGGRPALLSHRAGLPAQLEDAVCIPETNPALGAKVTLGRVALFLSCTWTSTARTAGARGLGPPRPAALECDGRKIKSQALGAPM